MRFEHYHDHIVSFESNVHYYHDNIAISSAQIFKWAHPLHLSLSRFMEAALFCVFRLPETRSIGIVLTKNTRIQFRQYVLQMGGLPLSFNITLQQLERSSANQRGFTYAFAALLSTYLIVPQ